MFIQNNVAFQMGQPPCAHLARFCCAKCPSFNVARVCGVTVLLLEEEEVEGERDRER